jgi:hypothetical protein
MDSVLLGNNFACEIVTSALQRHVGNESLLNVILSRDTSSTSVALWGCDAMYYLARGTDSEDLQRRLGAAGNVVSCFSVWSLCRVHGSECI